MLEREALPAPPLAGKPEPVSDLRWELDVTRERAEAQGRELAAINSSLSWRLTLPLRRLNLLARRLRRALRR
jgi:hypothetical protein